MKRTYLIIFLILCNQVIKAQQDTASGLKGISERYYDTAEKKVDTAITVINNTATLIDTSSSLLDSTAISLTAKNTYQDSLKKLLAENKYLNTSSSPQSLLMIERKHQNKDALFYAIFLLLLLFGLLKMFYSRYLNNLFRVFFNTSLRQSQLTDQLLQAKLPSLLFNIFFVFTGGFYLYFLLQYLGHTDKVNDFRLLLSCIAALIIVYIVKYVVLKFTGWISGYKNVADTYIFIVFLINKIIAIALIPIIIIMAFSDLYLIKVFVVISWLIIFLMLLLRFLRSYSILQNKIKVQRYHFFLYIIGIEILPLLLIYKTAMKLLTNNL